MTDSQPSRIAQGDYFADILQAANSTEEFWYYIIQRSGSNSILDLVKFDSKEAAIEGAQKALFRLNNAAGAG